MDKKDFVIDTIEKCRRHGFSLKLINKNALDGSGGWFDETELMTCIDHPSWMEIFVHESCHVDQFVEKSPLWFHKYNDIDIWDTNIGKKHPNKYRWAFRKTAELEIDCNKRAVDKIINYKLDIDLEQYIRKANCYHASYYYFHKYKCFYKIGSEPYRCPELYSTFENHKIHDIDKVWRPNTLLSNFILKNNTKL
jgi:hypothetical protein